MNRAAGSLWFIGHTFNGLKPVVIIQTEPTALLKIVKNK